MAFQFPPNPIIGQEYTPSAGITYRWSGLAWFLVNTQFLTGAQAAALYVPLTQKAAANGVASLNASAQLPSEQLGQVLAQCRFQFAGPTNARLIRYSGSWLTINGIPRQIPTAGVDLANTSLPLDDTSYHIYAFWTGSAIALEASTTPPAASANTGQQVNPVSPDRSYVGIARKNGGIFYNQYNVVYVRSYYNRSTALVQIATVANFPMSNVVFTQVESLIGYIMMFENERIDLRMTMAASSQFTTPATIMAGGVGVNLGTPLEFGFTTAMNYPVLGNTYVQAMVSPYTVTNMGLYSFAMMYRQVNNSATAIGGFTNFSAKTII